MVNPGAAWPATHRFVFNNGGAAAIPSGQASVFLPSHYGGSVVCGASATPLHAVSGVISSHFCFWVHSVGTTMGHRPGTGLLPRRRDACSLLSIGTLRVPFKVIIVLKGGRVYNIQGGRSLDTRLDEVILH